MATQNFEETIAEGNPLGQALALIGWMKAGTCPGGQVDCVTGAIFTPLTGPRRDKTPKNYATA
jgi:hypothetical protein